MVFDDPSISDPEDLWRRIPDGHWVFDNNLIPPRSRPSSDAFRDDEDGSMSVFIASENGNVGSILAGHAGYKVATIQAGFVRQIGLGVVRDPLDDAPGGHALVNGDKRAAGRDKKLAKNCRWVVGAAPTTDEEQLQQAGIRQPFKAQSPRLGE